MAAPFVSRASVAMESGMPTLIAKSPKRPIIPAAGETVPLKMIGMNDVMNNKTPSSRIDHPERVRSLSESVIMLWCDGKGRVQSVGCWFL
jgi:hypothetical protein